MGTERRKSKKIKGLFLFASGRRSAILKSMKIFESLGQGYLCDVCLRVECHWYPPKGRLLSNGKTGKRRECSGFKKDGTFVPMHGTEEQA